MEWQAISTIVAAALIVSFFAYISVRIGVISRDLKLREYENRAMANVMFNENGKKEAYVTEVTRLMKQDSYKHTGRM